MTTPDIERRLAALERRLAFLDTLDRVDVSSAGGYATIQDEAVALAQRLVMNFTGGGVTAADDAGNTRTNVTIPGVVVQDEGSALTQRSTLNFIGGGVSAVDNPANTRTNVTIPGVTIQDEGGALTQRSTLNFIGEGVTAADDAGNTRTNITIPRGIPQGNAFPGSPSDNDPFYRTDRDVLYFYDSGLSAWLTVEVPIALHATYQLASLSGTGVAFSTAIDSTYPVYVTRIVLVFVTGATWGVGNDRTLVFGHYDSAGTLTALRTWTRAGDFTTNNTRYRSAVTINTMLTTSSHGLRFSVTAQNGTPSNTPAEIFVLGRFKGN